MSKNYLISIFFAAVAIGYLFVGKVLDIQKEAVNIWDKNLPTADCGVVLTGASGRIREAFDLLQQSLIGKLIVSGVYSESTMNDIFPYLAYYPDVDPAKIILDKRSLTTYGNARFSLNIVEVEHCRDILLITSQIHIQRAYRIFRYVFPETINIKKVALNNTKGESGFLDLGLEVIKSYSYYIFRLVDI
jgi:uncharacterized SAM-binding protein YcdF (DUF218 family)